MNGCGDCGKLLGNENGVYAEGKLFHPSHFVCHSCGFRINSEEEYLVKNGQRKCMKCHLKYSAPKCNGCNEGMNGNCMEAGGKLWHEKCFKCTWCLHSVSGQFVRSQSAVFHRDCYWEFTLDTQVVESGNSVERRENQTDRDNQRDCPHEAQVQLQYN